MQNYTEIAEDMTLEESRALLLDNTKTAMSCNSGTSFPTVNLVLGMDCYRTDEKKLYKLVDVENQTWQVALDFNTESTMAGTGKIANLTVTDSLTIPGGKLWIE